MKKVFISVGMRGREEQEVVSDICYFVKGWRNHKGCVAEYEVCKLYGIKIIEEV